MIYNFPVSYDLDYTYQRKTCFTNGRNLEWRIVYAPYTTAGGFLDENATVHYGGGIVEDTDRSGRTEGFTQTRQTNSQSYSHSYVQEVTTCGGGLPFCEFYEGESYNQSWSYSAEGITVTGTGGSSFTNSHTVSQGTTHTKNVKMETYTGTNGTGNGYTTTRTLYSQTSSFTASGQNTGEQTGKATVKGGKWIKTNTAKEQVNIITENTIIDSFEYTTTTYDNGNTTYYDLDYKDKTFTCITTKNETVTINTTGWSLDYDQGITLSTRAIALIDTVCILEDDEIGYYLSNYQGTREGYLTDILEKFEGAITIQFNPAWRIRKIYNNLYISSAHNIAPAPVTPLQTVTLTIPSYSIDVNDVGTGNYKQIESAKQIYLGDGPLKTGQVYFQDPNKIRKISSPDQTSLGVFRKPDNYERTQNIYISTSAYSMTTFKENALVLDDGQIIQNMSRTTTYSGLTGTTRTYQGVSEGGPNVVWYFNGVQGINSYTQFGNTVVYDWEVVAPQIVVQDILPFMNIIHPINVQGFAGVSTAGQPVKIYRNIEATFGNGIPKVQYQFDALTSMVANRISALISPPEETFDFYSLYNRNLPQNTTFISPQASILSTQANGLTLGVSWSTSYGSPETSGTVQIKLEKGEGQKDNSGHQFFSPIHNQIVTYGGMQEITDASLTFERYKGWAEVTENRSAGQSNSFLTHMTKVRESSILPNNVMRAESNALYVTASSVSAQGAAGNAGPIPILIFQKYYLNDTPID